ncbi:hypothetical protein GCM10023153_16590 [Ornithinibacter aureus]|uniref:PASTA domain-containing protein n=1 Tax=Ornithinibacter aureus TaxID=622664 RepID=A0ABP8JRM9_9MICO|nr:hypothetical protein [Ornithinibacter aureus]KAF0834375.1 hypothetical protein C8E84_2199 [Ornithinibacter aureus]
MATAEQPNTPVFDSNMNSGDGATVGASRDQVEQTMRAGEKSGAQYEYRSSSYCQTGDPDSGNPEDVCLRAYVVCQNQDIDAGDGPATRIWRREITTPPSPWVQRVVTCFPDLADGPSGPTMADIAAAFHDTDFTKATVNIQPEGDVTLVTLPTYFEARFPDAGFQPGEVDTVTLVGVPVDIRPGLNSITYHLGDRRTLGPTASLGGPYPKGDVVTTYPGQAPTTCEPTSPTPASSASAAANGSTSPAP